jgi:hypothetical protein
MAAVNGWENKKIRHKKRSLSWRRGLRLLNSFTLKAKP